VSARSQKDSYYKEAPKKYEEPKYEDKYNKVCWGVHWDWPGDC
jgi:hypothetical protein